MPFGFGFAFAWVQKIRSVRRRPLRGPQGGDRASAEACGPHEETPEQEASRLSTAEPSWRFLSVRFDSDRQLRESASGPGPGNRSLFQKNIPPRESKIEHLFPPQPGGVEAGWQDGGGRHGMAQNGNCARRRGPRRSWRCCSTEEVSCEDRLPATCPISSCCFSC